MSHIIRWRDSQRFPPNKRNTHKVQQFDLLQHSSCVRRANTDVMSERRGGGAWCHQEVTTNKVEVTKEGNQSQSITCCRTAGAERKNCRMDDKATQEWQVNNRALSLRRPPPRSPLKNSSTFWEICLFAFWPRVRWEVEPVFYILVHSYQPVSLA